MAFIHRPFLLGVFTSLTCGFMSGCTHAETITSEPSDPPNIIMIVADDLGWGDLGVYGNKRIQTPNLDRLAEEGRLFTQFYMTSPVCSPSRASILSANFAPETGIHYAIGTPGGTQLNDPDWLDEDLPGLYDVFFAGGYETVHFGKWHLGADRTGPLIAPPPSEYGIHISATTNSNGLPLTVGDVPVIEETLGGRLDEPVQSAPRSESTKAIIDKAIEYLEAADDRPFLMSLWTLEPHAVLSPTEEQMLPYLDRTHQVVQGRFWGSETIYYASVTNLDSEVGRLLQYLEANDQRDNTIVLFTSDNGPSPLWSKGTSHAGAGSAGPFRGVKGSLYEGGVRVPLIVSWPDGIAAGGIDDSSVISSVDLLPTLIDLAGIPASIDLSNRDGENAASAFRKVTSFTREKPLFWDYRAGSWGREIQRSPRLAMRDGDWKLLMNPDGSRVELYNLTDDPSETSNVAKYEVEQVDVMTVTLMDWFQNEVPDNENAFGRAGELLWEYPGSN